MEKHFCYTANMTLPIIYSAHHASYNFGAFEPRVSLSEEEKQRFSDLGTERTVPQNGYATLISEYSRGVVDLNRSVDNPDTIHPTYDFARPLRNAIWKAGQELTVAEKSVIKESVYDAYHSSITKAVTELATDCLVVAWDNTAHYIIGKNAAGDEQMMVPIVLSNQGDEGKTTGRATTCKPELLEALGNALSRELAAGGLPFDIYYNLVFKGGNVARTHTNFAQTNPRYQTHSVQSLQLEYDMQMTHDQATLAVKPENIKLLREAFEVAVAKVAHFI